MTRWDQARWPSAIWPIPIGARRAASARAPRRRSRSSAWVRPPKRSCAVPRQLARCDWSMSWRPSSSWWRSGVGKPSSSALERATRFRRFKASDVRAILEAGPGLPTPVRAGQQLVLDLPPVPVRPLSAYALVQGGLL